MTDDEINRTIAELERDLWNPPWTLNEFEQAVFTRKDKDR